MKLELFKILHSASIKETLLLIDTKQKGFTLVSNESDVIIGVVTDGDIRRKLLTNITLDDAIKCCTNYDFV